MTDKTGIPGRAQALLRAGGIVLALLAVVFVVRELLRDDNMVSVSGALVERAPMVLLAAALYALCSVLLCVGWALIVRSCGITLALLPAGLLYARTHLYRYLPSNVVHFVSRHGALYSHGASHRTALLVNGLELVLQVIAAVLLAALLWPALAERLVPAATAAAVAQESTAVSSYLLHLLSTDPKSVRVGFLIALGFGGLGIYWVLERRGGLRPVPLVLSLLVFLVFFLGAGLSASLLTGQPDATLLIVVVCALAWLLGAVVPGASAGLGVREAVLVAGLAGSLGASESLVIALGYRLATIGGDILLAFVGWLGVSMRGGEPGG